ncbi:spermatogenesis- and oogenesis-specific basic helix-loop-helix-containing protein 2 [Rhynchonycteris naso]
MAASSTSQEPGQTSNQAKIDLLLVGDVTVQHLADIVQKFFSSVGTVTITVSGMEQAATLLGEGTFSMVFLKPTSPAADGLEAVQLIRFGKKINTHLPFVFIIPENFKGCISGHGADITLTEPLTVEKLSVVVKYWKTYFSNPVKNEDAMNPEPSGWPLQKSCSEHLGCFSTDLFACPDSLMELRAPLSDFKTSKMISLLHSSKEKLRRERIKHCCEQLRALVPCVKGRKNDVASILEATVDYVTCIREKIPPAVMGQITEVLQSNRRFCKKQQMPAQLSLPDTIMAPRENGMLASTPSPMNGISFLTNKCLNMYSVPASGGSVDDTVRDPSGCLSEDAIGDVYKSPIPSAALSLNSFCAVRCYSTVIPSYDAAASTNQNISVPFQSAMPKVSKFLPQHCKSALGHVCTTHADCLVSPLGPRISLVSVIPASKVPDLCCDYSASCSAGPVSGCCSFSSIAHHHTSRKPVLLTPTRLISDPGCPHITDTEHPLCSGMMPTTKNVLNIFGHINSTCLKSTLETTSWAQFDRTGKTEQIMILKATSGDLLSKKSLHCTASDKCAESFCTEKRTAKELATHFPLPSYTPRPPLPRKLQEQMA